jgi:hypothetical protein
VFDANVGDSNIRKVVIALATDVLISASLCL